MSKTDHHPEAPTPFCDFFIDRNGDEYIVEVCSHAEGFAEDYGVYLLREDGSKGESVEPEPFDDEVQCKFRDWIASRFDDGGRESYPASHY